VVFERRDLTAADVVHLYETEMAPLREEAAVKRGALIELQREMGEVLRAQAERVELEAQAERAEARAAAAEQRVAELIASRSWRLGQALLQPVRRAADSVRRKS
ncbi:MAG: hypothetical protein JWL73_771, partial [Actinomycetia bacterium]|nr:hypothetical protein [Actinomycetes bacterium]